MNKNELNESIGYYLKLETENKNITPSQIKTDLNVSQQYVSALLTGKKTIGKRMAKKLKELYGLDESILLGIKNIDLEKKSELTTFSKDVSKKSIPYYNVDFAGGWSSEEIFSQGSPDFYINNPEFQGSDFACNLVGKSVSEIIPDGSVVGFKIIDDWHTFFPPDELYGIITKNEFRTVKLISRNRKNKTLILKPAPSKEYAERFTEKEEIPEDYIIKFFQVIAYACFERLAQ